MERTVQTFIEHALGIDDPLTLNQCFIDFMRPFGFTFFAYYSLTRQFRRIPSREALRLSEMPVDYARKYVGANRFEIDPVMEEVKHRHVPFYAFEVEERGGLTSEQKEFFQEMRDAGLADGLAVPVFLRPGDLAYFALGTDKGKLNFSKGQLLEIQEICQQMHQRYNELLEKDEAPKLSKREQQVLECIAKGQSNTVIAEELGISAHTVDTVVRRCFEKLGVSSRVEAVLSAISRGFIIP
jgi:DNA-binding CsgD family transcriptional regulator